MAAPSQTNSTITTGGTAQTALVADPTRRSISIQNTSDTNLWVNFLKVAVADDGFLVGPGVSREMYFRDWPMIINAVSVVGATTGKKFNISDDVN